MSTQAPTNKKRRVVLAGITAAFLGGGYHATAPALTQSNTR